MTVSEKPGQLADGDAGCVLKFQNVICNDEEPCRFKFVTHLSTARIRCGTLVERNDISASVENC